MSVCCLCTDSVEKLYPIRFNGTKMVCEVCWSEAACHWTGDLEGRIEAISEFEGWSILWYWARGHVDKVQFRAEMMAEFGIAVSYDDIEYTYARFVPAGGVSSIMCSYLSAPGRGAFPVTLVDWIELGADTR